eukprot:1000161_1
MDPIYAMRKEEKMKKHMETSDMIIFRVNKDGMITHWNHKAEKEWDLSRDDAIGEDIFSWPLKEGDETDGMLGNKFMASLRQTLQDRTDSIQGRRSSNAFQEKHLFGKIVPDERDGKFLGAFAISQNISKKLLDIRTPRPMSRDALEEGMTFLHANKNMIHNFNK